MLLVSCALLSVVAAGLAGDGVGVPEGTGGGAVAGGLVQPLRRRLTRHPERLRQRSRSGGRRRQPDDRSDPVSPEGGERGKGGGLARPGRPDQYVEHTPGGDDGFGGRALVGGERAEVALGAQLDGAEHLRWPVRCAGGLGGVDERLLRAEQLGRGEQRLPDTARHRIPVVVQMHARRRSLGGDLVQERPPLRGGGHPQQLRGADGGGAEVPRRPHRTPRRHVVEHLGDHRRPHLRADVVRMQRPPVGAGQRPGGEVARLEPGEHAGTVRPVRQQIRERPDRLRRSRRARQVLACPGRLHPGRGAAATGFEVGEPLLLCAVDRLGPGREVREQVLADPVDLERRVAARASVAHRPLHRQPPPQLVRQQRVIQLRHRDDRRVHGPPVQAPPRAVGALDLVGDDDVGVQVRVPCPGVPVIERRSDHAARADLMTARLADARADDALLDELQR